VFLWVQELLYSGGLAQEPQCPGASRSCSVLVAGSRSCSVLVDPGAAMSLSVGPGAAVS